MKTAVFYENIYEGAKAVGVPMDETLEKLKNAGMELIYLSPVSYLRDESWLKPLLEKLGIGIEGMHVFCDFSGEPDTEKYKEYIDLAIDAGAGNILFVPGMLSGKNTLSDFNNIARGIRRAVEYGKTRGLPVLMEDYDGLRAPYNSILSLGWFLDNVEGLGCAFDTGNFAIFHEDELEAFELFKDKIVTLHLKDRSLTPRHAGDIPCVCADGKCVYTCETGSGCIRIAEIIGRLKQIGYAGNVIAELYSVDHDFQLKDIFASIENIKRMING